MKSNMTQKLTAFSTSATLALFLSCAQAGEPAPQAVSFDLAIAGDPFIVIDYEATIAKLPAAEQARAQSWLQELEGLETQLENDTEATDVDTEAKLMVISQRLEELLLQAKVAPVEIDLLEQLPEDKQLQALKLWRSIQRAEEVTLFQGTYSSAADRALNKKYDELEAILAGVSHPAGS